jgi:hypothetical protein
VSERSGVSTDTEVPIRQLDWRFLLPEPEPERRTFRDLVIFGGPAGMAARATEIGVADTVRAEESREPAELVVVLDGAGPSAGEVASRLRPGGVSYWELGRTHAGAWFRSPARFCATLRRAGLEPIAIHACIPDFRSCKLLLPIDIPQALSWYLTSLFPMDTFARRMLALGLQWGFQGNGEWAARWIPSYSVTAVGREFSGVRLPAVLSDREVPAELRSPGSRVAVLTDAGNRVALLPFAPGAKDPGAVLKVPKVSGVNDRTENEHHRLKELRRVLSPKLASRMPEPLALFHRDGIAISIENFLPGSSLLASSGAWARSWVSRREDLGQAARWLADFHRDSEIRREAWGASDVTTWVDQPLDLYRRAFGVTEAEERLFAAWRLRALDLSGQPFPVIWHHRDYNVWNIFRTKGGVSVIDWEGVRPGPPLCDLLHFVTHWHETVLHVEGEEARLEAFRQLFFGEVRLPSARRTRQAICEDLDLYMQRLELRSSFLPFLLVYTWVELALRRRQQQEDMGELTEVSRVGNRNFPYVEIIAEHTGELFGETTSGAGVVGRMRR